MKIRKDETGQALVEFALTLPVLVLMTLAMAELGQICYAGINVSNAAKAAGQYAAQNTSTAVQTARILAAAQNEVESVPGLAAPLDLERPTSMPDGTALPAGTVCNTSGDSYSCSYCSCSSPDVNHAPFACGSSTALSQCSGISHLEQNIIIETHISVNPLISAPGLEGSMNLYGHAVVKRLQ